MGVNLKKVNRYLEFVTERMDLHHLGPRSFFWLLLLRVKRKVTHSQITNDSHKRQPGDLIHVKPTLV